jgi:exocyst complex component 4
MAVGLISVFLFIHAPWLQILRLFSESAESITGLKGEMEEAKKLLGRKNKHLGQLWYRSLTLRHVLSLLDQVEDVAKVSV